MIKHLSIPDYTFHHSPAVVTNAGGVAMYISNKFHFETIQEYKIENADCENRWIKLQNSKNKANYVIGVAYHHPTSRHDNFIDAVNCSIDKIAKSNQTFYLLGDFNINTSPNATNSCAYKLINMLLSNNCHPLITIPIRVTNISHTIIDNIITNDPKLLLPGVIHYLVFSLTLNYCIPKSHPENIFCRDKNTFNPEAFQIELESNLQLLSPLLATANKNNFNQVFSKFIKIIENTIEIHAPLNKLLRKQRKLQAKPWITKELLSRIQQKRKLYRSHYLNGDETEKQIYKNFANKLNKAKTKAKQTYFREQFLNNKDNPRKTWQLIKSAIPFSKPKMVNKKIDQLIYNDQELVENQQIAEKFNEHFTSVGIKLVNTIHSPANSYRKFLPKRELFSIFLEPPRYNEIYNAIHSLDLCKSSVYDNIDAYFIRTASYIINPYLTHLCFLSFEFGIFPESLKIAKVIPIFKTGSKTEVNNYRPISILSNFSKNL